MTSNSESKNGYSSCESHGGSYAFGNTNDLRVDQQCDPKDQLSLDEFEQIERLIQENTFADSDAGEGDFSNIYSDGAQETEILHQDTGYQSTNGYNPIQPMSDAHIVEHNLVLEMEESDGNLEELQTQVDTPLGQTPEIDQRESLKVDDNEKLAATFNTTENFELFLKQQLEVQSSENMTDEERKEQKKPDKKIRGKARNVRKARSPAANRVRKIQRSKSSTYRPQSSAPESSDELSLRSDVSKTELQRRLRTEHKGRKNETEVVKQLQGDYDDLLTRFAEAENVIDQLRIGAKIDLFAHLPSQDILNDADKYKTDNMLQDMETRKNRNKIASVASSSGHTLRDLDSLTESSLKLPSAANTKFLRISLEHRAKEIKEQMQSFETLLNGNHVAADEKKKFLKNIEDSLHELEKDFLSAKRKNKESDFLHNASDDDFDLSNELEEDICRLGEMLAELKNVTLQEYIPSHSLLQDHSPDVTDHFNSSDSEIDIGFENLLQRYNKPPIKSPESSLDEISSICSGSWMSDKESSIHRKYTDVDVIPGTEESGMPERFLRPSSSVSPSSSPRSKKQPNHRSPDSKNKTIYEPNRSSKSRLPRPVRTSSNTKPVKPKPQYHGFDVDSGFMGSESSRQSYPKATPSRRTFENNRHSHPKPYSDGKSLSGSAAKTQISPVDENATPRTRPLTHKIEQRNMEDQFQSLSLLSPIFRKNGGEDRETGSLWAARNEPSQSEQLVEIKRGRNTTHSSSELHHTYDHPVQQGNIKSNIRPGTSSSTMFSFDDDTKRSKKQKNKDKGKASITSEDALGFLYDEIAKLRDDISKTKLAESSKKRSSEALTTNRPNSASRTSESNKQSGNNKKEKASSNIPSSNKNYQFGKTRNAKVGGDSPISMVTANQQQKIKENNSWVYVTPNVPGDRTVISQRALSNVVPIMIPQKSNYVPISTFGSARIYIPAPLNVLQQAKHYETIKVVPGRAGYRRERLVNSEFDENDSPLRRSQLTSLRRSASVGSFQTTSYDQSLILSLKRAERAANGLRSKSRSMYRSLRDSYEA